MAEGKIVAISIIIAERSYSLKVSEMEIDMIERVVKEINAKIVDLQTTYSANDKQDSLAMALLTYAVKAARLSREDSSPMLERLRHMDESLQQLL